MGIITGGRAVGKAEGVDRSRAVGMDKGMDKGRDEGRDKGRDKSRAEVLVELTKHWLVSANKRVLKEELNYTKPNKGGCRLLRNPPLL